jgi:cation:H+ antiporter
MDPLNIVLASLALVIGLVLLVWSADRFIQGASASARHFGMSPLLIGMLVVGFGTSAPEMVVSAFASIQGNPGIAYGNALGSNIANIALIIGITALISPIVVSSGIVRLEMPVLLLVTALSGVLVYTGELSRIDGLLLLAVFIALTAWSLWMNSRKPGDHLGAEVVESMNAPLLPMRTAIAWSITGLLLLIASSRVIVWGAVIIARGLGVDDLVIGLTIVALGTSLPELASCVAAARRQEHDIVVGNIIGSNLFNTLVVLGIAGVIAPSTLPADMLSRDFPVMAALTVLLFIFAYGFHRLKRVNRIEGGILVLIFVVYTCYLIISAV